MPKSVRIYGFYSEAIALYKENCPERLKVIAKGRLKQVLTEGVVIKRSRTITTQRVHEIPIYNEDGEIDFIGNNLIYPMYRVFDPINDGLAH